jgi:hypothetical protein
VKDFTAEGAPPDIEPLPLDTQWQILRVEFGDRTLLRLRLSNGAGLFFVHMDTRYARSLADALAGMADRLERRVAPSSPAGDDEMRAGDEASP